MQAITDRVIQRGSIYRYEVPVITRQNESRTVFVSALASYDTEKRFTGINFVLGTDVESPAEVHITQSQSLHAIIRHVLSVAGNQTKEKDHALRTYFVEALRVLFSVLSQFGGEQHKGEIIGALNHSLRQKNLDAEIRDQIVTISEDYEGEDLSAILSELLQQARSLVSQYVGEQVVQEKMDEFEEERKRSLPDNLEEARLKTTAALGTQQVA